MEESSNSGDNLSALTANLDRALDEYEKAIGLNYTSITPDAEKYLSYSQEQIEKMTPQECASASILMSQLSFHIQRSINKEQGRVNWAAAQIRKLIGRKMISVPAYSYEERREFALADNETAQKLERLCIQAQARVGRLQDLTFPINALAKTFQIMSQRNQNAC